MISVSDKKLTETINQNTLPKRPVYLIEEKTRRLRGGLKILNHRRGRVTGEGRREKRDKRDSQKTLKFIFSTG